MITSIVFIDFKLNSNFHC